VGRKTTTQSINWFVDMQTVGDGVRFDDGARGVVEAGGVAASRSCGREQPVDLALELARVGRRVHSVPDAVYTVHRSSQHSRI